MKTACFAMVLAFGLLVQPIHAFMTVHTPATVAQGEVLRVMVLSRAGPVSVVLSGLSARITRAAFPIESDSAETVWVALIGISSVLPTGRYEVRATTEIDSGAYFTAPSTVEVAETAFPVQRVRLSEPMTRLLTTPDPRRDRESRVLNEIINTFRSEAVYEFGPFVHPVPGARETAFYGDRRAFVHADGRETSSVHHGWDLAAPTGTPVYAAGAGRVVLAEERIISGNSVVIEHLPGVYGLYYHLERIDVDAGEYVEPGRKIGEVGATGLVTGPHLHWEIRVGPVAVEPRNFLSEPLLDIGEIFGIIRQLSQEGR